MVAFFHKHTCNKYCIKLKLSSLDVFNKLSDTQKEFVKEYIDNVEAEEEEYKAIKCVQVSKNWNKEIKIQIKK